MKKDCRIEIRVCEEDKKRISESAKLEGKSVTEYITDRLLLEVREDTEKDKKIYAMCLIANTLIEMEKGKSSREKKQLCKQGKEIIERICESIEKEQINGDT